MGQKTHPKGFRLVTTQKHLSEWYVDKLVYPSLIEEDFVIREKINNSFSEFLSLAEIEINRINQNKLISLILLVCRLECSLSMFVEKKRRCFQMRDSK